MIHERDRGTDRQTAHRNCDHSCTFGSTRCSRSRRHCCSCPARPHGCDRHCGSRNFAGAVACYLRSQSLAWFQSYIPGRTQHVRCGGKCSTLSDIICGVPQGSVLGPILVIIYTADLASIVAQHGLSLHQYADDNQGYGSCQSDATSTLSSDITECVDDMYSWMRSNRLQLNGEKTEVMWCSFTRRLSQLPNSSIVVAGANVHPVSTVRNLGVYTDSDLGVATHIRKTVSCCFAALVYRKGETWTTCVSNFNPPYSPYDVIL